MPRGNKFEKGDRIKSLRETTTGDGRAFPAGTLFSIIETPDTDPDGLGGYYLRADPADRNHYIGIHPKNMNASFEKIMETSDA